MNSLSSNEILLTAVLSPTWLSFLYTGTNIEVINVIYIITCNPFLLVEIIWLKFNSCFRNRKKLCKALHNIFKGWKQICHLDKIKKIQTNRCKLILYTQLLWIILNWSILGIITSHIFNKTKRLLSVYKSIKALFSFKTKIRHVVRNVKKTKIVYNQIFIILEKGHFVEKRIGWVFSNQILVTFLNKEKVKLGQLNSNVRK